MIEVDSLTKYFGARKGVGPLSFRIDKGEVIGLLGLNGAGKTTTLRMLSTDLLPTSGRMVIEGIDLAERPEQLQARIGYLPDRPPLYGEMTVREYLRFAARLRGFNAQPIDKRVDEVLEETDLVEHADERIDTLSHGYRQRTGIAQAIVHRPALLLLDEPISGLDPVQIVEMRTLIRSLRGDHTTILSSHILNEISETCDRLLVLRDGRIIASGTERELSGRMAARGVAFRVVVRVPEGADRANIATRVEDTVREVAGVDKVTSEGGSGPDRVVVVVESSMDVRPQVVRKLVLEDHSVLVLERISRELESLFLELTGAEES